MGKWRGRGAIWVGCAVGCSAATPTPVAVTAPATAAREAAADAAPSTTAPARPWPADGEVQRILDERLGDLADYYGIVVGMVDADGPRVVSRGHFTAGDAQVPDGDTLFELGSITKVFTSLLLAIAVERGEVGLDDPLTQHLPAGTTAPSVNGRQITLRDLATHTSGLPRTPWSGTTGGRAAAAVLPCTSAQRGGASSCCRTPSLPHGGQRATSSGTR